MKESKMSRRNFLKAGALASAVGMMAAAPVAANAAAPTAVQAEDEENGMLDVFGKKPKYVFLFIGDGMGTAQIQSARFYQGTATNNGAVTEAELSFTQFPEVGSVTTYDSTSFCPDSASTATSIATGHKTESGVINMCPWTRDVPYETIAEKLHKQRGYKVGVISSVNIDHATPAAFYAHQKSRKNYYDIGVELANSGFEYFAGGEFQKVNGDGTVPNNHEVAAQAGYNVVTTQAGAAALTAGAGKTLIIAENLADGKAMNYAMDAAPGEWQLTDYVRKGIELLDNKKGFFLMTESGKIDWACHANDAAARQNAICSSRPNVCPASTKNPLSMDTAAEASRKKYQVLRVKFSFIKSLLPAKRRRLPLKFRFFKYYITISGGLCYNKENLT